MNKNIFLTMIELWHCLFLKYRLQEELALFSHSISIYQKIVSRLLAYFRLFAAGIYLVQVNNDNTRTMCEICSNLTIKSPERRYWRRSGVFNINFQQISHIILLLSLLTRIELQVRSFFFLYICCSRTCKH